jgi:SIR2-like domain
MMSEFIEKVYRRIDNDSQRNMLGLLRRVRTDDLESILGELDIIIGMEYASSVNGMIAVQSGHSGFSLERQTAQRLRTKIKHEIIREYRNVSVEKILQIYEPLFNALFPHLPKAGACLAIFTTNYDPAIEKFYGERHGQYALCDGFDLDPASRLTYWGRSAFDKFEPRTEQRNLVLFKLHGSVDWLRENATGIIRRGQAIFDEMDRDAYKNILIYPATRKIATEDPFYTGYEYFERCCERAKVCVAIGYSFRDYDALTRLRGAASVNDGLNLVLLDPKAEEILKTIQIPDERKIAFNSKFGELPDQLSLLSEYLGKAVSKH